MFTLDPSGWVNFFFKLLNLLALLALFYYIFKQYMLEGLRNNIIKEKQAEEGMQTKVIILEQKGKELVHAAFTQEQYAQYLFKKADQWRQTSELEKEKKNLEFQLLRSSTIARTEKQTKTYQTERLMNMVIPKALLQARTQLSDIYKDEKKGNAYVQNILTLMKKSL